MRMGIRRLLVSAVAAAVMLGMTAAPAAAGDSIGKGKSVRGSA